MSLLEVENLHTQFVARDRLNRIRIARALNGVSFRLDEGEVLGLVGETGAGKSLTVLSIMGLLRPPARVVDGRIRFAGQDLLNLDAEALRRLRGDAIGLVVQSPRTALDPLSRIGEQIVRAHRAHRDVPARAATERALDLLKIVGIPDPERRFRAWPHQLSGGMAQRVLIAMALVNEPRLLMADEPTTGLDVTVQAQILDLLRRLARERALAALIITHDLGIVAHYCDRIAVMFAGQIVETGPVRAVFDRPRHPYTRRLIDSTPERLVLGGAVRRAGAPPDLYDLPRGCLYADRCEKAAILCAQPPPELPIEDQFVLCHYPEA